MTSSYKGVMRHASNIWHSLVNARKDEVYLTPEGHGRIQSYWDDEREAAIASDK